jgi:hypothetical protein
MATTIVEEPIVEELIVEEPIVKKKSKKKIMKKYTKKVSIAPESSDAVVDTSGEGETTMCLGQPAEHNVHAEDEVVVADGPTNTPGTSAFSEAAADLRADSELKPKEPATS